LSCSFLRSFVKEKLIGAADVNILLSAHSAHFFNPLEFNIVKTLDAVQHFGGRRQVAEALGVTRQAVSKWGKYVAEGSAYKLQHLTKGKLKVIKKAYANKYAKD
jgi:hypothetical protein